MMVPETSTLVSHTAKQLLSYCRKMLSQSARSRWLLCFALAVFQTLVGLAVAILAVVQMVLGKYFHIETPHVDTCHDSTVAAVLQGQ